MKQTFLVAVLGLAGLPVLAQEVGTVLSSTPVYQQVAVPRQVCSQAATVERPTSGAGGLIGAIAGAAIGSQIGGGSGRGVAMVAGTVGGALLGNHIEANGARDTTVHCTTETVYESRAIGYNVTYEYNGRQYQVQLPYDPGPTIQLQVTPVGAGAPPAPSAAPVQSGTQPPVVVAPPISAAPPVAVPVAPVVYQTAPAYPVYRSAPPVSISLGLGYVHHHGGRHHHRH